MTKCLILVDSSVYVLSLGLSCALGCCASNKGMRINTLMCLNHGLCYDEHTPSSHVERKYAFLNSKDLVYVLNWVTI